MNYQHQPLSLKSAELLLDFGFLHYQGRKPKSFIIEDDYTTQKVISDAIQSAFRHLTDGGSITIRLANSIEEGRSTFGTESEGDRIEPIDLVLLDFKIPARNNEKSASDDTLGLWFEEVARKEHLYRKLIFMTSWFGEAKHVADRVICHQEFMAMRGKLHLLHKSKGYVDIILAYLYSVLAVSWRDKLLGEMRSFDFDLLTGRKPGPRIRSGELPGMDDFRDFVARMEVAWPFLAHWPEPEESETKMLLNSLTEQVRNHFHVDESGYIMEKGVGKVRLDLKLCDPLPKGKGGLS